MIVRHQSDGSLVMIAQNDHGTISGLCAAHWGNARFEKPRPYESCVRAAYWHDLVWLKEETNPRFDPKSRTTPNFLDVPNETQLESYKWANQWVASVDRYAGLLVNKHRTGIWRSRYGMMKNPSYAPLKLAPEIEAFVAESHAEQNAIVAAAGFDQRELTINYNLLQIWDLLSLFICTREPIKENTFEPVPTTYSKEDGICMRLTPITPTRISIDPYPFDQPVLEMKVIYRRLSQQHYDDAQAFQTAFMKAEPQVVTFTYVDPAAIRGNAGVTYTAKEPAQ
jgi:hypothetical protein